MSSIGRGKKGAKLRKGLVGLVVLLAVVGGGIYIYKRSTAEEPIQYLTTRSRKEDLRQTITATGTIQPVSMVNVGTQISGTIKELYIDYNSQVKKGGLIAVIDPATQQAQVDAQRASLAALRADLLETKSSLNLAEKELNRSRQLYGGDLISRADLDSSEASYEVAQARVSSANMRIRQQEASLRQAELQLSYTRIYSPVDGVVVTKSVEVGQTVAASYNTPTIAEIAEDLSFMQVEVKVDEADIGGVRENMRAEFTIDAFPEKRFTGSVGQIRLSPKTESNVTSYVAIVGFENEGEGAVNLIPGMTANVTLIVTEKKDVITVPNSALRFRPVDTTAVTAAMGGGPGMGGRPRNGNAPAKDASTIYRLEKGEPVQMQVERGISDGTTTEITSGLEEGVDVITGIELPKDR